MKAVLRIATPLTIGSFILMAATGVLMFFHLDSGLNKDAHEWLSWVFLLGVGLHITRNLPSLQRHLKTKAGIGIVSVFLTVLALSTFAPSEKDGRPPISTILAQLSQAPIESLAVIADLPLEDLQQRLNSQGINVTDSSASLKDLTHGNKEKTMSAIKEIFTK